MDKTQQKNEFIESTQNKNNINKAVAARDTPTDLSEMDTENVVVSVEVEGSSKTREIHSSNDVDVDDEEAIRALKNIDETFKKVIPDDLEYTEDDIFYKPTSAAKATTDDPTTSTDLPTSNNKEDTTTIQETENTKNSDGLTEKAVSPHNNEVQGDKTDMTTVEIRLEPVNVQFEPVNEQKRDISKVSSAEVDPLHLAKRTKVVDIYGEDSGPRLYNVTGCIVTPPIISGKLLEAFSSLPIYGKPKSKDELPNFQMNKIKEFVGGDLNDEEFGRLADYCSPEYLKLGNEVVMPTAVPTQTLVPCELEKQGLDQLQRIDKGQNLCTVRKCKLRMEKDLSNRYPMKLKYRGMRLTPLTQEADDNTITLGEPLQPGKDLLFRVRLYRPFPYCNKDGRTTRSRHSVFSRDIVILGRQKLSALRDSIVCANDVGVRVDVADRPDVPPPTSAKEMFPSGFLFINNVFYVDTRDGCVDYTAPIRQWAANKRIGNFPVKDLCDVRVDEIVVKLGHPEVYYHQGNCEHPFTFSEIRLLNPTDPLKISHYPCHTAISQNQAVYCTTCAEYSAKWIVIGCARVPFDPAFFCETCLKMYLYKDGQKIGDFKAYAYKGNEMNVLKPNG